MDPGSSSRARSSTISDTNQVWVETDDAYVFQANFRGLRLNKDDFSDVHDDKVLLIKAVQTLQEVKQGETWTLIQGYRAYFRCEIRLPENVKVDPSRIEIDGSVLTVILEKIQTKLPDKLSEVSKTPNIREYKTRSISRIIQDNLRTTKARRTEI